MAAPNISHIAILMATSTIALCLFAGCKPLQVNNIRDRIAPSNQRDWSPEMATLPFATVSGETIHIKNIRNLNYISNDDFVVKHYDRTINLSDVQSVDFVVTPFQTAPALAHTMLSFGLTDGTYLGISVEIRNELEEEYSPFLGISNQFEIMYVIADEKDLIRVRTEHRNADVYLYPSIASPEQSQRLFGDILQRVNKLGTDPEFYHTIRNNCTTNLVDHVNELKPQRIAFNWRVLLPGFSAEYAYEIGLLDNRIPFEDLKSVAYINDLARKYYDAPDFSQKIRMRRRNIERLAARQQKRQATVDSSGQKFLDTELSQPRTLWR